MRHPFVVVARCLAVVAVLGLIGVAASAAAGHHGSPYLSALSNLAASPVTAATHCENRACATDPRTLKYICVSAAGTTCAAYNSKYPVASKCIENAC